MNVFSYAWLIPVLPALGFIASLLFGYRLGQRGAAYLTVALLLVSSLLATALLFQTRQAAPNWDRAVVIEIGELEKELGYLGLSGSADQVEALQERIHALEALAQTKAAAPNFPFKTEVAWLSFQNAPDIPLGFYIDPFAALMTFMVAFVSLLIHLFSIEYMQGEARYPTFFAYLSLFSAAMLAMVMSSNLFHVLLFWELMGVMSYLLIGFFYKKIAAQQAMKKAFLVTKLADLGLLLGIFWIYRVFGTLDIATIQAAAPGLLAGATGAATGIGLLLFIGAMGKSAQFPLHVWLLDAMEGPTPVSAMIHAATMVAAGVYVMARVFPILELGNALMTVAWIGAITALFAALLAPAFADIKKILAWSTVSQLGLMFLALGAFGWVAAVFHLVAHAFFKALLFLCAGSMIHGSGTQDIFEMDKLKKHMPATRLTFIIGALSLAGVLPFAGFWSKDEVLLSVKTAMVQDGTYTLLLIMAYAASLLTAFYISRAYLIAFEQPRQDSPWKRASWNQGALGVLNMRMDEVRHDESLEHHSPSQPHESGWHITTALWLLAGSATVFGLLGSPLLGNPLQSFVYYGSVPHIESLSAQMLGFVLGTAVALAGIALAALLYVRPGPQRAPVALTRALQQRLYIDQLYYRVLAQPLTKLAAPVTSLDRHMIDGLVDSLARLTTNLGQLLRRLQTGKLEHYSYTLVAAALVLLIALSLGGRA